MMITWGREKVINFMRGNEVYTYMYMEERYVEVSGDLDTPTVKH